MGRGTVRRLSFPDVGLLFPGDTPRVLLRRYPLPLCGIVIAARVVTDRTVGIAASRPVGASQIFDRVSQVGVGVEQAFGGSCVAKAARGRELDLHQADRATVANQARV